MAKKTGEFIQYRVINDARKQTASMSNEQKKRFYCLEADLHAAVARKDDLTAYAAAQAIDDLLKDI